MSKGIQLNRGDAALKLSRSGDSAYRLRCVAYPSKEYTGEMATMDIDDPDFEMGVLMAGLAYMIIEDQETLISNGLHYLEQGYGPYNEILSDNSSVELLSEEEQELYHMTPQGEA